jgi:hypothetical protein
MDPIMDDLQTVFLLVIGTGLAAFVGVVLIMVWWRW